MQPAALLYSKWPQWCRCSLSITAPCSRNPASGRKAAATLCWSVKTQALMLGAYRDAVLQIGLDMLLHYDEVVLMNYTLAGPVGGCSCHVCCDGWAPGAGFLGPDPPLCYAQPPLWRGKSHGAGAYSIPLCCGAFPHDGRPFLLTGRRPPCPPAMKIPSACTKRSLPPILPPLVTGGIPLWIQKTWQAFSSTPLWPAPSCCWRTAGARFSSAAAFLPPYADELRRTDGQAAAELYDYLKSETDYPVDDLLRALLPVQPLAAMAQNLHWHYILPQTAGECAPVLLDANTLGKRLRPAAGCRPLPAAAACCRGGGLLLCPVYANQPAAGPGGRTV